MEAAGPGAPCKAGRIIAGAFCGKSHILNDVTLDVREGEIVAAAAAMVPASRLFSRPWPDS
jgi:hypothetical protein